MTLERQPKPPLGTLPVHIMEMERDVCGLCGMTGQKIADEAEDFCPVIIAANEAAGEAWKSVIDPVLLQANAVSGYSTPL